MGFEGGPVGSVVLRTKVKVFARGEEAGETGDAAAGRTEMTIPLNCVRGRERGFGPNRYRWEAKPAPPSVSISVISIYLGPGWSLTKVSPKLGSCLALLRVGDTGGNVHRLEVRRGGSTADSVIDICPA